MLPGSTTSTKRGIRPIGERRLQNRGDEGKDCVREVVWGSGNFRGLDRVCEIPRCSVHFAFMSTCPSCQHPATKRDGYDAAGRQRFHCCPCHRDFTAPSTSIFSGHRWPQDVILMAVQWYCSLPLSAAQVVRLLAERNIDVTARTGLNWVQTFGPQLAAAIRKHRRRVGRKWTVDEVFCFRGRQKLYLYRAVDAQRQVIDVLLRDKRDPASAEAFFRQALARTDVTGSSTGHCQLIRTDGFCRKVYEPYYIWK